MIINIPGQDWQIRLFERVACEDSQYDIVDAGIQQEIDGKTVIDSIAIGGSFSTAKAYLAEIDAKHQKSKRKSFKKGKKRAKKQAPEAVAA